MGDGGSLGVHSHVQSPLRKAASNNFAGEQRLVDRGTSPVKKEPISVKRAGIYGRAINRQGYLIRGGAEFCNR